MNISRPSGMMGDLCSILAEYISIDSQNLPFDELFEAAYEQVGFKLKLESVIKKFNDPKQNYKKYYAEDVFVEHTMKIMKSL